MRKYKKLKKISFLPVKAGKGEIIWENNRY